MKKLLSVVIAICMMLVAFGTVSYADVNAITPEICVWGDTTVGNEIVVSVSIPAYTGAAGGSLNLVYDNTRMAVIDATAGEILGGYSVIVNKTYAANKVRMTFSGSSVVSAYGGEILNVTFALLEAGSAEISTENMKLADINSTKLTCTNSDMSVAIIEEDTSVHVTGIRLNKTNITLEQGDTATLIATVLPTNATNKTVFWESSDSSVAEVTEDGVIYAINPGTAYISVITDDGGYTKGCTVIVTEQIIIYDNPTISISDIKTRPGKSIDVSVELSNNTGFANLVMQVGYDKDILTLVGVEPNESVTEFTPAENYNVYPYNMAWNNTSNITYNGSIATLTFEVNEDTPDGNYSIWVEFYSGPDSNWQAGINANYDEDFEPVDFIYLGGTVNVKHYIPGDICEDDIIDNKDATYLLRYLADWDIEVNEDALDVDGNGTVDYMDATILLRYLAGWDVTLH